MAESILNIEERPVVDDSIKEYEYVEYQPISGSQLNTSGQIRITIEHTDDFFYPRNSWLLVEGNLVKSADEGVYADDNAITLLCLIVGGGSNKMLLRENQKNNRPKTKNYITDEGKKIQKTENYPRTIRDKRVTQGMKT